MHNQSSAAITRFTSHQRVASMLVKTSPQSEGKLFIHLVIIIPYEPTMARNDCREALLSPALLPPPNTRVKSESVHKLLPTSWAVNCVQECREPLLGAMTADASLTVSRCNHSATHQLTTSERTWIRQTPTWMRCYLFPNCNMEMTLTRVLPGYCQKMKLAWMEVGRQGSLWSGFFWCGRTIMFEFEGWKMCSLSCYSHHRGRFS